MASTSEEIEKQWLSALRQGDESALRHIFDQHYPLLVRDVYRLIQDTDTCKDLAQEVFVELWKKREVLTIHSALRPYLRRAAVNKALNHIKTQKKISFEEPENWVFNADDTPQILEEQTSKERIEQALHEAIDSLPEKCRIVFNLSRFEQMSHKEISESLGISVKTIENQITKAFKILRGIMSQYNHLSSIGISCLFLT